MPTLFHEDFSGLPVGPLPTDFTAVGEYHYAPPEEVAPPAGVGPGEMGPWYEPMRGHPHAPFVVFEDDGRHRLLQTVVESGRGPRVLVAGDDLWHGYTVTLSVQPLRPDGFVGVCLLYRTSRRHYRFGLEGGERVLLLRQVGEETAVLAEAPFRYDGDRACELRVDLAGRRIVGYVDGAKRLEATDDTFSCGRVALYATTTCIFDEVEVAAPAGTRVAFVQTRDRRERELDALREALPRPVPWREIDTRGFGVGRQIRFGHLASNDRLDLLLAQNIKFVPGRDDRSPVRCLTAVNLDGDVLWQWGEPSADSDAAMLTADVPVQVYDIDGDGRDEVLCLKNFKLYILDGATGAVRNVRPLPRDPFRENEFGRLVGDAIILANLRGLDRPRDILVKNRYRQLWAFDDALDLMWTREFPTWLTGHFAQPYDFDGDGRDEVFIGYSLLGPDGEMRWSHDWEDHTDEIAIGPFDPAREGVQIALVCGEAGFNILAPDGEVLYRERLGHAQRLSAARFREDLPGLQFYVTTFWGHAGIVSFHDCRGRRLHEFEPAALGTIVNPVNWTGEGTELALLSGSRRHGGMVDGCGRRVVLFPEDGGPERCAEATDLVGDPRDEIVLWDPERIVVYTQDRPFTGGRVYAPTRFPHYNASNYRAEIGLPAWRDLDDSRSPT